jgi:cytochrome P450
MCIRAILHDENTYPEPHKFSPERFEKHEKNRLSSINELPHVAFGFGRR